MRPVGPAAVLPDGDGPAAAPAQNPPPPPQQASAAPPPPPFEPNALVVCLQAAAYLFLAVALLFFVSFLVAAGAQASIKVWGSPANAAFVGFIAATFVFFALLVAVVIAE